MKRRKMAVIIGTIGLTCGLVLLLGSLIILLSVMYMLLNNIPNSEFIAVMLLRYGLIFFTLLNIIVLISGIFGALYYRKDTRISIEPNIILIAGSIVGLLPGFEYVCGITSIIAGALYLKSLKNFK